MKLFELTIMGDPMPKQSVKQGKSRSGKKVFYKDSKITEREAEILSQLRAKLGESHIPWYCKPIIVSLTYVYPYPKTFPKRLIRLIESGETVYKITAPDVGDNLNKLILDVLQGFLYENDSEIIISSSKKVYGEIGRTEISLREMSDKVLYYPTKKPRKK